MQTLCMKPCVMQKVSAQRCCTRTPARAHTNAAFEKRHHKRRLLSRKTWSTSRRGCSQAVPGCREQTEKPCEGGVEGVGGVGCAGPQTRTLQHPRVSLCRRGCSRFELDPACGHVHVHKNSRLCTYLCGECMFCLVVNHVNARDTVVGNAQRQLKRKCNEDAAFTI